MTLQRGWVFLPGTRMRFVVVVFSAFERATNKSLLYNTKLARNPNLPCAGDLLKHFSGFLFAPAFVYVYQKEGSHLWQHSVYKKMPQQEPFQIEAILIA